MRFKLTSCGEDRPQCCGDEKKFLLYATTKMMMRGSANARMKVEIGLRTQMSSKFLRTNAQICLRSKFMVLMC